MRKSVLVFVLIMTMACVATPVQIGSGISLSVTPSTIPTDDSTTYPVVGTVNVRECPSTTCRVIGNLFVGDFAVVEGSCSSGKWCKIQFKGGIAYVFAPCLGMEGVCR